MKLQDAHAIAYMRLGRKLKSRHVWTIRELNELRSMAPDVTLKMAADHFNVPKFAVKNACHLYGIKVGRKAECNIDVRKTERKISILKLG